MSDPRDLFPEEVWEIILDCVDDPQDILSCYQTCNMFRRHLSLTINTWGFQFILPSLFRFLQKSDVLQCRLVSKKWMNGVDNFLQSDQFAPRLVQQLRNHRNNHQSSFITRIPNEPIEPIDEDEQRDLPENRAQRFAVARPNHIEFANFQNRFVPVHPVDLVPRRRIPHQYDFQLFKVSFGNNSAKNPFPSRAVVLVITDATLHGTCQLLIKFGSYIWSLNLIVQMSTMGGYQDVAIICNILKRVPNLKHLLIEELSSDSIANQKSTSFLKISVAPVLPQLKWLELNVEFPSIRDFLVKSYEGGSVTIFSRMGNIEPCHLSNDWKHLKWQSSKQSTSTSWQDHIRSFENLNIPLESIELQYSECEDFQSIFKILSKYGKTVRRITLIFKSFEIRELVEMRNQVDPIYTSFVSEMKCLENFIMILDCADSVCGIEFLQFAERILNADWIEMHSDLEEVMSGFTNFGVSCIFAGLKTKIGSLKIEENI